MLSKLKLKKGGGVVIVWWLYLQNSCAIGAYHH